MAQPIPWYYKFYWKMEGWLQSKLHKSLNSDRSIFYKQHSESARKEAPGKVPADNARAALYLRHKPLHERKILQ